MSIAIKAIEASTPSIGEHSEHSEHPEQSDHSERSPCARPTLSRGERCGSLVAEGFRGPALACSPCSPTYIGIM